MISKPLRLTLIASSLLLGACASVVETSSSSLSSETGSSSSVVSTGGSSSSNTSTSSETSSSSEATSSSEASSSSETISSSEMASSSDYGPFTIVATSNGTTPSYDASTNVWTLGVSAKKAVYTLTGYFDGLIRIANPDSLSSYKGVELILNNVYLANSEEGGVCVDFENESKYVQIDSPSGTINQIVAKGTAVESTNNVRLGGEGSLTIVSETAKGVSGDDICFYGGGEVSVTSLADALHGKDMFTNNTETADALVEFTGTLFLRAGEDDQALDFCDGSGTVEDPYTGSITVDSGAKIVVSSAFNVARCNTALTVEGSLIATSIASDPVITQATGNLIITVTGVFSVNGVDIPSQTL